MYNVAQDEFSGFFSVKHHGRLVVNRQAKMLIYSDNLRSIE